MSKPLIARFGATDTQEHARAPLLPADPGRPCAGRAHSHDPDSATALAKVA